MLARPVGRALRREIHTVFVPPATKLRRVGLYGVPLTLLVTAATGLLWALERTGTGTAVVTKLVDVYSALPLGSTLQRLPGSLVAPAPDLPVVGALVQVVIVFGVAELTIGRWHTLIVALSAQAAATATADLMVWLGPQTMIGVDQSVAFVRDTGPSVAVVALTVHVCFACRAPILLLSVVGAMLVEVGLKPDLAGREHIVAVACGLLSAGVFSFVTRLRRKSPGLGQVARHEPYDLGRDRPFPVGAPELASRLLQRSFSPPGRSAHVASSPDPQTVTSPARKAPAGRQRRLVVRPDRGLNGLTTDLVLGWAPTARFSPMTSTRARSRPKGNVWSRSAAGPKAPAGASAVGRGVAGDE